MQIRGQVILKRIAPGSKSERDAFVLKSAAGDFVLRKQGANPFVQDTEFNTVLGREIDVEGRVLDYLLLVDSWKPA
ncbi:MAG: hypothetical protein DMG65_24605 [Candidatus Angelobacter sp. Gp1-AA117]|nr:MAG: hypothetical protein DMG65_24605 [Candidatus Angelobacter sp. Gp1-AA117]